MASEATTIAVAAANLEMTFMSVSSVLVADEKRQRRPLDYTTQRRAASRRARIRLSFCAPRLKGPGRSAVRFLKRPMETRETSETPGKRDFADLPLGVRDQRGAAFFQPTPADMGGKRFAARLEQRMQTAERNAERRRDFCGRKLRVAQAGGNPGLRLGKLGAARAGVSDRLRPGARHCHETSENVEIL
jgi:hypothetical protein